MGWITEESKGSNELKPSWEYKKGVDFITVLPNTTRDLALIAGDNDPTKTWVSPIEIWVHQFKTATGFATVICDKWNEACPLCYENELYKNINPNYKNTGGRTPFPISSKALIQVYDFELNRVLWLLAGKKIIDGMDFILTRMASQYRGMVSLTRTGEKLNTNYRVDISPATLTPAQMEIVKQQTIPLGETKGLMQLTHEEFKTKSGVDPVLYFQNMKGGVDISKWGAIPTGSVVNSVVANQPVVAVNIVHSTEVPTDLQTAVNTICTTGVYNGKPFKEVFVQTGKSYLQFLLQAGTDSEKSASKIILDKWDEAYEIAGGAF